MNVKVVLFIVGVVVAAFFLFKDEFMENLGIIEKEQLYVLFLWLIPAISYGVFIQETGSSTIFPCMEQEGLVWWRVNEWGMPLYPYLFFGSLIIVILFFVFRLYNGSRWDLLGYAGMMTAEFFFVNGIVVVRNFILDDLLRNHFFIRWIITVGVDGFFTIACLLMAVICIPFIVIRSFLPSTGAALLHTVAQVGNRPKSDCKKQGSGVSKGSSGEHADETQNTGIYPPYLYSGTVCYGRGNSYGWGVEYVNESDSNDRIAITNIYSQTENEIDTNAGHFTF